MKIYELKQALDGVDETRNVTGTLEARKIDLEATDSLCGDLEELHDDLVGLMDLVACHTAIRSFKQRARVARIEIAEALDEGDSDAHAIECESVRGTHDFNISFQ